VEINAGWRREIEFRVPISFVHHTALKLTRIQAPGISQLHGKMDRKMTAGFWNGKFFWNGKWSFWFWNGNFSVWLFLLLIFNFNHLSFGRDPTKDELRCGACKLLIEELEISINEVDQKKK